MMRCLLAILLVGLIQTSAPQAAVLLLDATEGQGTTSVPSQVATGRLLTEEAEAGQRSASVWVVGLLFRTSTKVRYSPLIGELACKRNQADTLPDAPGAPG